MDGVPYTIVGMGEKLGKTLGRSQDNWVGVPLTSYQKTYGTMKSVTIYMKAPSGAEGMQAASDQVRVIMRDQRHDRPGEDDSFTLETSDTLAGLLSQIINSIGGVAIAIAAISLGGGRRGDYEHHAGERDGADARDWGAEGAGCEAAGPVDPVPDGVGNAFVDWWGDWRGVRACWSRRVSRLLRDFRRRLRCGACLRGWLWRSRWGYFLVYIRRVRLLIWIRLWR